jgi:predicted dehydrogenase
VARAIEAGEFGRITSAVASVAWWRGQDYYDSAGWRGTWAQDGGGATMNQGVHTVDLLLWLLGRPVEVYAQTAVLAHERIEVEDVAVATVRFASGALAVLHATTAAYPGLAVRLQIHGSSGSAVIHDDQLDYFGSSADVSAVVPASDAVGGTKPADAFVQGHVRQYDDIVDAITHRRAPGVTVTDALLDVAFVKSMYLSARLGRPIEVDAVLAGDFDDELASEAKPQ